MCGCVGLLNCVDKCFCYFCFLLIKDKFICIKVFSIVLDCRSFINSSVLCGYLKVDFIRNGFVW